MQFMLFTNDVSLAERAEAAGVHRIVIDLEQRGKTARQRGYHLECNRHVISDISRIRRSVSIPVMCRVNPLHDRSQDEIERVIDEGASIVMLPMFSRLSEVDTFLGIVRDRVRTSLLFETRGAILLASRLRDVSFDEVYLGLNDLAIAYGVPFCYQLLSDGVVDQVRSRFADKPFGFGGITTLDGGKPLSTRLIIAEQARLKCTHVILRRAFKKDIQHKDITQELRRLTAYDEACARRSSEEVQRDAEAAHRAITDVSGSLHYSAH